MEKIIASTMLLHWANQASFWEINNNMVTWQVTWSDSMRQSQKFPLGTEAEPTLTRRRRGRRALDSRCALISLIVSQKLS